MTEKKAIMISYSMCFVGTPYVWGGEHPSEGYDCSGFIQEVLASVGLDPKGDQTSQALYDSFETDEVYPERGDLIFFGRNRDSISHVALCIGEGLMIEAGGGNSKTKNIKRAIQHKAMVRIRPISNRRDFVGRVCISV